MTRSTSIPSLCSRDIPALKRAGAELLDVMEALQARGRNVVTELQSADRPMQQWNHYPPDDANDLVSGYRWYYHAHPGPQADAEHGHFHVFAAASTLANAGRHTHLIGLSVSANGMPLRMFTTNRWVTNELYAPAGVVLRKLQQFRMRAPPELALVHRWLAAVVALFRPQIGSLLVERDERLQRALAQRPGVFEDRRTTLLSQCRLDLQRQLAWIESVRRPRVRGSIALTGARPDRSAGEPLRGTRGLRISTIRHGRRVPAQRRSTPTAAHREKFDEWSEIRYFAACGQYCRQRGGTAGSGGDGRLAQRTSR